MFSPGSSAPRRSLRVGVLCGGRSGEHEVSLESADAILRNLRAAGHTPVRVRIDNDGRWFLDDGSPEPVSLLPEPGREGLVHLSDRNGRVERLDVVFPVLHGSRGEDGAVQGLLDLAEIPYVGSGVLAGALGMDKAVQKRLWGGLGLPVVRWIAVSRPELERERRAATIQRVESTIGLPCFTKPANLGSSVGVNRAGTPAELAAGLDEAAEYDARVLVEEAIDARELECAVLGNDRPEASVVGEVLPGESFYSYRAKYLDSGSTTVIPADVPDAVSSHVRTLAVQAFQSIDATGLARVDFFLDRRSGTVYLNEINTMPGFTTISMYPKLWEATGLAFPDLLDRLLDLAFERHAERAKNRTSYPGAHG